MFHALSGVRIAGLRAAVPQTAIALEDEAALYGPGGARKVARLKATLGMDRRRVCPPGMTASDLCAAAARALFAAQPGVREGVEALIFLSQTPDWPQPATACELQSRLGLPKAIAAFDVNQGCAGYVYGLWIAASLVAAGAARRALLLVGDAPSGTLDQRNRITAPVFGDGGSATILERDESGAPLFFGFGTDGAGFEAVSIPAGGARIPFSGEVEKDEALWRAVPDAAGNPWRPARLWMDGGAIFNFTMDVVPDHLREALGHAGMTQADIDWLILHQANRQIVETIARKADFSLEKTPWASFAKYGNLAAASIPAALCDAFGWGERPGTLLLCGYGIGLAWGSCIARVGSWNCAPPLECAPDPETPGREERIAHWERKFGGKGADD